MSTNAGGPLPIPIASVRLPRHAQIPNTWWRLRPAHPTLSAGRGAAAAELTSIRHTRLRPPRTSCAKIIPFVTRIRTIKSPQEAGIRTHGAILTICNPTVRSQAPATADRVCTAPPPAPPTVRVAGATCVGLVPCDQLLRWQGSLARIGVHKHRGGQMEALPRNRRMQSNHARA